MSTVQENPCATGKCAYGEPCRCDFYANWVIYRPPCVPKLIGGGGYLGGFKYGHKRGYDEGYRDAQLANAGQVTP